MQIVVGPGQLSEIDPRDGSLGWSRAPKYWPMLQKPCFTNMGGTEGILHLHRGAGCISEPSVTLSSKEIVDNGAAARAKAIRGQGDGCTCEAVECFFFSFLLIIKFLGTSKSSVLSTFFFLSLC